REGGAGVNSSAEHANADAGKHFAQPGAKGGHGQSSFAEEPRTAGRAEKSSGNLRKVVRLPGKKARPEREESEGDQQDDPFLGVAGRKQGDGPLRPVRPGRAAPIAQGDEVE